MKTTNVLIGKTADSFEDLQILSQKEAEKITFGFWTFDFPELICEAVFAKSEEGNIGFQLDFEQTTL